LRDELSWDTALDWDGVRSMAGEMENWRLILEAARPARRGHRCEPRHAGAA
jgi:hypothetical protein